LSFKTFHFHFAEDAPGKIRVPGSAWNQRL
jgi:hypothetical protein